MATPIAGQLPGVVRSGAAARARREGSFLPAHWSVVALFVLYPLWWALGLAAVSWPLVTAPMLFHLLSRRTVVVPRGFGLWVLFVSWMFLSASQLEQASHYIAFAWRTSLWLAALVVLVYLVNAPRDRVPANRIVDAMLCLWGATVIGGYLGLVLGDFRLSTPAGLLIPGRWIEIDFIRNTIFPRLAQVHDFLGYPLPRPSAPFTFTNEWGANLAVLAPVVVAAWPTLLGRRRTVVATLAVASIVPMIISVNRGLWVTLIGTFVYTSLRLAHRRDPRAARRLVVFVVLLVAAVVLTPLGSVVSERFESDHSNSARLTIYTQASDAAEESPLLGFGSPRENPLDPDLPPVGTHGTFWLVLFSHGIPGALLFVGALGSLVWRTSKPKESSMLWLHGAVVAGMLMIPFYDLLPVPIFTVMAAAAIVLRDGSLEAAA